MAADRAAELTEAYRSLADAGRRAEYDSARGSAPGPVAPSSPKPSSDQTAAASSARTGPASPAEESEPPPASTGPQFKQEKANRDTFVRKATVNRFRQALEAIDQNYDEAQAAGFDVAFSPKSKLFGRSKNPRLLGRFVGAVDAAAIAEAWGHAAKLNAPASEELCVFLMASEVAPARQLAEAINQQRRKHSKGGKVVLIPVDARNWDAHVPTDAPAIAKTLLTRLRTGG